MVGMVGGAIAVNGDANGDAIAKISDAIAVNLKRLEQMVTQLLWLLTQL